MRRPNSTYFKHRTNIRITNKRGAKSNKTVRIKRLSQWVFDIDIPDLEWQPLSAAMSKSGAIVLYPVRKVDLELQPNSKMYNIIGVSNMKNLKHYICIEGSGLINPDWQSTVIDRKPTK